MVVETGKPAGQPSVTAEAGLPGTPPETKTFTQSDMEKAVRDTRNAALGEIGTLRKESANAISAAKAAQDKIDRLVREQEEAELVSARDDPAQLTAVQERHRRRQVEAERDAAKLEAQTHKDRATQLEAESTERQRGQITAEVATRFGVDPVRLGKLARYTDGSPEAIEDLAKDLPKATSSPPLKPDSGQAIGGSLTAEQIRADYIKDPRNPSFRERYLQLRQERSR